MDRGFGETAAFLEIGLPFPRQASMRPHELARDASRVAVAGRTNVNRPEIDELDRRRRIGVAIEVSRGADETPRSAAAIGSPSRREVDRQLV